MADPVSGAAAVLLGVLFAWASLAKAVGYGEWVRALSGYGLNDPLVRVLSVAVPIAEASVAILVIAGRTKPAGALAVGLLASFSGAIVRARRRGGGSPPCGCFGGRRSVDFRLMLARNALLGSLAGIVLVRPEVSVLSQWKSPGSADTIPFLLAVVGAGLVVWVGRVAAATFGGGRRS